jgi:diguanylate cyclase (GGDEF)-like protein
VNVLAESDPPYLLVALALAILVATLHLLLAGSLGRPYIGYWAIGWSILAVHLAIQGALRLERPDLIPVQHGLGGLASYGFGVCLILGCRYYALGRPPSTRALIACAAGGTFAVALPLVIEMRLAGWLPPTQTQDLSLIVATSGMLVVLYLLAARYLWSRGQCSSRGGTSGRLVLGLALLLASLYELQTAASVAFAWRHSDAALARLVLNEAPFDLVAGMLVAFGCVMLALDSVREELERVNAELATASRRLEKLAHQDAMTEALNRHAFYTLLEQKRPVDASKVNGAVAVLDLDRLKPINDAWGHAAGDTAIRLVAKALRSLVRADDLLFRWGGDEFLVLLPNVAADEAARRLARLNEHLRGAQLPGADRPIDLTVSYGVAGFQGLKDLENAIATADRLMFQCKAARRAPPNGGS